MSFLDPAVRASRTDAGSSDPTSPRREASLFNFAPPKRRGFFWPPPRSRALIVTQAQATYTNEYNALHLNTASALRPDLINSQLNFEPSVGGRSWLPALTVKLASMGVRATIAALRNSRKGPIALYLAIFAALTGALLFNLYSSHRRASAEAERTATQLVIALDEHTQQSFHTIDGVLQGTIQGLELAGQLDRQDWAIQAKIVSRAAERFMQGRNLALVDVAGEVYLTGRAIDGASPRPLSTVNFQDRDFFAVHRDRADAGLFIGAPAISGATGKWYLPVSRRLSGPNGEFAGIIAAIVDPERFAAFFKSLHVGRQGSVSVYRSADAVLLLREPFSPHMLGKTMAHGPLFRDHLPKSPAGAFRAPTAVDGIERVVAYREIQGLPLLLVVVGIGVEDALTDWSVEARNALAMWMTLLLLTLMAVGLQMRQDRRRERAEIAVLDSERRANRARVRLHDAIASVNEGFYLFDADDRLVLLNDVAKQNLGAAAESATPGAPFAELVGAAANALLAAAPPEEREATIAARLAHHRQPEGVRMVRPVGERWFHISERPTSDGGMVILETDITAMKRVEDELRASKEEAERASRTKSDFLANVSHELRTPLNSIIGFSELLKAGVYGDLGDPRYGEYAGFIHQSGQHLLRVINDILDLSKVEAGMLDLDMSRVDVGDVIARSASLVRDRAEKAGLKLVVPTNVVLPPCIADETKLKQILLNLLSNAIKFTPSGGEVRVIARLDDQNRIEIAVCDTGIGMAQADIPKALSPFGQVDNVMTRRHEGTGLGLPLTKHLVDLHGGTLEIESAPGAGTTVRVRLPRGEPAERAPSVSPEPSSRRPPVSRLQ